MLQYLSPSQANKTNNGSFVIQGTFDFSRVQVELIKELELEF